MLQYLMMVTTLCGSAVMMALNQIEAGALYAVTASIWGLAMTVREGRK